MDQLRFSEGEAGGGILAAILRGEDRQNVFQKLPGVQGHLLK